ncbi:MAG TPA: hypothetical protein EYP77_03560, partial [Anaerolineae bacterium]|nr:hypothetical protein [Anaerolineae bacterium]
MAVVAKEKKLIGYLPNDAPPIGQAILLGFQHVLTMFPATVLVALLVGFDVGARGRLLKVVDDLEGGAVRLRVA